jgi:outer membrane protein
MFHTNYAEASMYKKIFFTLFLAILLFPGIVKSQTKIGYVISEQIMQNLPEAQTVSKQLETLRKEAVDTLESFQKEIQAKVAEYQQKESLMTEDAKKKTQKELYDMDAQLKELNQKKSDELKKKNETLMQPIIQKINNAIEFIAKDEGFSVILDKNVILYGDQQINITNKVLDIMVRNTKLTPKKKTK